jgi:hypothetical protein
VKSEGRWLKKLIFSAQKQGFFKKKIRICDRSLPIGIHIKHSRKQKGSEFKKLTEQMLL